jgi:hypothetical protein
LHDAEQLADMIIDQIIATLQRNRALQALSTQAWTLILADVRQSIAKYIYARIREHIDRSDVINALADYQLEPERNPFETILEGYADAQLRDLENSCIGQDVEPDDVSSGKSGT